ncbi:XdhC family protein [Acetobacteraceae bacterium]|nr:XdhC family protein [Acetobacteraceae bacterium]
MEKMPSESLITISPQAGRLTDRPKEIFTFILEAFKQGQKCALITLVEIIQGSSRALGAHMAVREDGLYCGFVSGGCVEGAVAQEALEALKEGKDRFCHFGKGSPHFDILLPCGGGIKLAIHLLKNKTEIQKILSFFENRQASFLTYSPKTETLTASKGKIETGWKETHFAIAYRPALRLFLSGGAYEGGVLAEMAETAGLEVFFAPHKTQNAMLLEMQKWTDENTAIALLHHDPEREFLILCQALKTNAFYIGALGSLNTHEKRKARLLEEGVPIREIQRLHAPIGLFGPTRNARTLAASIIAEILKKATNGRIL